VTFRKLQAATILLVACVTLPYGCGDRGASSRGRVNRDPNVLVAYVACGLVPAFEQAKVQFENENTGKSIRIEEGEPSVLAERLRSGAVPDVLICPGDAEIGMLEREGHLDRGSRQPIESLGLAIAVRADSPLTIHGHQDLLSDQVRSISMAMSGITSPGADGKSALERAGVWSKLQDKLTLQTTPLQALQRLVDGEADAAIVYDPCFLLYMEDKVPPGSIRIAAPLAPEDERASSVHIVLHKRSPNGLLAQRLVRLLQSRGLRPLSPPSEEPALPEEQESPEEQD